MIGKPKRKHRSPAQALVEFALILPILLLVLFTIIETARLLHAWVTVENGARFGVRYAVTGGYEDLYCAGFTGGICNDQTERDAARIPSIRDAALSGAASVWRDPTAPDGTPGFLKITVCSNKTGVVYFPPDVSTSTSADCQPLEDAGGPGNRVSVTVDFDHPIISPLINTVLPKVRLSARREGIVEQFRVARVIGLPATISVPTFTPTNTATATTTGTSTSTATVTPTACKVLPQVRIRNPLMGESFLTTVPSYVWAYDPDDFAPDDCQSDAAFYGNTPDYINDGLGISQVQIVVEEWTGMSWANVHSQTENVQAYCGFGGNGPCNEHNITTNFWPGGAPVHNGMHRMLARARDNEGSWSPWTETQFSIAMPPTPTPTVTHTPTPTATPSCSGVSFGTFQFLNYARIRQRINNTTYPGLQVVAVTIYWDAVETASNLYGLNEYMNYARWNGSTFNNGNDYSSSSTSNTNMPQPVTEGTNASTIVVDWNGGYGGYWNNSPYNFSSSNFGFFIQFSDPSCNLFRSGAPASLPTSTYTLTPTNTPTITRTPTITTTPTNTLIPTATPHAYHHAHPDPHADPALQRSLRHQPPHQRG